MSEALENAKLDDLRAEIDQIDDQIHDLLMRRTEVVAAIGARKRGAGGPALALRPGREAAILRRLMDRHQGPFPPAALVRMWRELLSAQVALQAPFNIAAFAPEGVQVYRDLARDQFGSLTPIAPHATVNQVLNAVVEGEAKIGVLPMPWGERPNPWWRGLVSEGGDMPRVIARLPFVQTGPDTPDRPSALVVARLEPEKSGADVSLVAVEVTGGLSRDRLRELLTQAGLDATWVGAWQDPDQPGHDLHLIAVAEFLDRGEPRLDAFRAAGEPAVVLALPLGSYAEPLRLTGDTPAPETS